MADRTRPVRWSRVATADLVRIAEFLRETNPATESKMISQLIDKASQLEVNSRLGQVWHHAPESTAEIRTLLVGRKYRLVYEVAPAQIMVLQVLDMRRNNTYYR